MPLLHDGLVFTFTHGSSKYNDRQNKIETQEEEEEAKEFALFRQEMLQEEENGAGGKGLQKAANRLISYLRKGRRRHHMRACERAGKQFRVPSILRLL